MSQKVTINIYRDGVWAGGGELVDGEIVDCSAVLGGDQDESEETYCMIEEAIEEGKSEVVRPDGKYTWSITPATHPAVQAAKAEGIKFFWAHMNIGDTRQFVGSCWADGGFSTDDNNAPVKDFNGNTVASNRVEELDQNNPQHVEQCENWYGN